MTNRRSFGLLVRLVDMTMSEDLWSMLDPAGVLPRDPALIVADLSGTAVMERSLFEAETADEAPGTIETLAIDALRVKALGAEVTGSGSLEFVESAGELPDIPQPVGTIELVLVGANALLDRLVQMGLVGEDQAMGARMMFGVFARQGEGEDTLVSTITLTPDGQISANGQRIR